MIQLYPITYSNDHFLSGVFQIDISGNKKPLLVAVGLLVLDPDRGLGVVGLLLVSPLHIQGWQKEFCKKRLKYVFSNQVRLPVGSGSTAPLTSLIWPGMLRQR